MHKQEKQPQKCQQSARPKAWLGNWESSMENSHPETDPKYQNVYENQARRLSMSLRHFTKMEESFELTVMRRQ